MDIYERFFSKYDEEIRADEREKERQSILQKLLASGMSQEEAAKIVGLARA